MPILIGLAAVIAVILATVWEGFVLTLLWNWHMMPWIETTFNTTIHMNVIVASVINILVSILTSHAAPMPLDPQDPASQRRFNILALKTLVILPGFALLLGWILTWF